MTIGSDQLDAWGKTLTLGSITLGPLNRSHTVEVIA